MAASLLRRLASRNDSWLLHCPISQTPVCSRGVSRGSPASGALSTIQDKPRTAEDLPRVSFLELLYRLVFQGFYNRLHELQVYEKQLYGPIYRDGIGSVSLNTPELMEEILRKDDKFPCRGDMGVWREYRDMRGFGYGPFTDEGETWYKLRVVLNKRMLHPKESARYSGTFNEVVKDFIKKIHYMRQRSPTGDSVTNMANELYLFSLEGIASVLFETRLGCLEKKIPAGTQDFISAIAQMFSYNTIVFILPRWSRNLLPYWGRFIAGWEGIFSFGYDLVSWSLNTIDQIFSMRRLGTGDRLPEWNTPGMDNRISPDWRWRMPDLLGKLEVAKKLIDKKMELIEQRVNNHQDVEGEYLTYLLSNTQMSIKDVYGSVTELLLAGVDTTSNTLTWTLHELSRNPHVQDRLYKEVSTMVPSDQIPTAADVTRMPYLKAVIKEALRMYPVVPLNARIISERSVSIGGYQFPKKTSFSFCHYAINHDESTFPDSFAFKPERWLRDNPERPNPFSSLPFGFGVRSCVGRRIAELEMYLLLFQLIREFKIKPDPTLGELKSINRSVLVPDKQLNLHFVDRRCENTDC